MLASRWKEHEVEREGPVAQPSEVTDIALNTEGLFLTGQKGGLILCVISWMTIVCLSHSLTDGLSWGCRDTGWMPVA